LVHMAGMECNGWSLNHSPTRHRREPAGPRRHSIVSLARIPVALLYTDPSFSPRKNYSRLPELSL
jgi:hypothetical protein